MNRARFIVAGALLGGAVAPACGPPTSAQTLGTNSNWFSECSDDADCARRTSCQCARCTRSCDVDADCEGLADAHCVSASEPASRSQCLESEASSGLCLPSCTPGGCPEDQACIDASCVSNALPANAFCAPEAAPLAPERTQEDELFALVQTLRSTGGVSCGSNAPSVPAGVALRASAPLRCAARVFAADIDANGTQSLVDSSGRSTKERMSAAGYVPKLWGESFAVGSSTASDALAVMLADQASCIAVTRDGYTDLGVAYVGRVYVVTIGSD
jgi:uncharacterized protein YkwD